MWTVAHRRRAGWRRSITQTAEASAPTEVRGWLWKAHTLSPTLGTKPGAWRSPLNEQMRVIPKVEFKPTTSHRQGNTEKGEHAELSTGSTPSWQIRVQTGQGHPLRCKPPGRAGKDPLGRPCAWLWASNEDEKMSRAGLSAPPAPQVRKAGPLAELVSWDPSQIPESSLWAVPVPQGGGCTEMARDRSITHLA